MPRKVWNTPPRRRRGASVRYYPAQRAPRPDRVGGFLTRKRGHAEVLPAMQYPPAPMAGPVRPPQVIDASELVPTVRLPELYKRDDAMASRAATTPKRPLRSRLAPAARLTWRYRWQIAPVLLTAAIAAGAAVSAVATGFWLLAVAVAAHVTAQHGSERIAGRAWLSVRERTLISYWAVGGTAWSLGVAAGWWPVMGGGLLGMVFFTGIPVALWLHGRRTRRSIDPEDESALSAEARYLIAAWPFTIGLTGPEPLRGSNIVASTMREPALGAYAFSVELADRVHAEHATGDELRRYLERVLRLPVKTVTLAVDRDDSARVKITMTPARHLEGKPVAWQGPILNPDGTVDLADAPDGSVIRPALHNEDGVEHFAVFGTSGVGKSHTVLALLLPGVIARREVVFYVDGGRGTSVGHIAGACDSWATDPDQWRAAIRVTHRVMRARKTRRARQGLSRWCGAEEVDPIITLDFDEATTVLRELSRRDAELVMEILREGRKLGVRVGQATQDPMGDDLIGGRKARGLMGGAGSLIAHRPGDGTANTLTSSSTSAQIDLRELPPEPGWCAIIRRGAVLSRACKVRKPTEEQVRRELDGFVPRGLDGEDLDAAGDDYTRRVRGIDAARRMTDGSAGRSVDAVEDHELPDDATEATPDGAAHPDFDRVLNSHARLMQTQGQTNRLAVLATLRTHGVMSLGQVRDATGLSQSTVKRALRALAASGDVTRNDSGWIAAEPDDRGGDSTAA